MGPLGHKMPKLPLVLVCLVIGVNHAGSLSLAGQQKLAVFRNMLAASEKAGLSGDAAVKAAQAAVDAVSPGADSNAESGAQYVPEVKDTESGTQYVPEVKDTASDNANVAADMETTTKQVKEPEFPGGPHISNPTQNDPEILPGGAGQNQFGQLFMGIFNQLKSGNPVKMVVDIKNPEVMIDEK